VISLVRDISERLKAQKEAMQATEALAEIGELASMIVHEIRNPLTNDRASFRDRAARRIETLF
jgi:signal transduction histidine kinase